MNYVELKYKVTEDEGDMIIAFLCDMGFESFYYEDEYQCCYIQEAEYETYASDIEEYNSGCGFEFSQRVVAQENWNAQWESDFEPIQIDNRLGVRTPQHPESGCAQEILITPNMSFGTGHHPTTYMILEAMLSEDFSGKSLLDVGCGSGVLGIMAAKNGAASVVGVDIDSWAAESARGNLVLNNVQDIMTILDGTVKVVGDNKYNYIVANIARNVLQNDMQEYYNAAKDGGKLLCSGFLECDSDAVIESAQSAGFTLSTKTNRSGWVMLAFTL